MASRRCARAAAWPTPPSSSAWANETRPGGRRQAAEKRRPEGVPEQLGVGRDLHVLLALDRDLEWRRRRVAYLDQQVPERHLARPGCDHAGFVARHRQQLIDQELEPETGRAHPGQNLVALLV